MECVLWFCMMAISNHHEGLVVYNDGERMEAIARLLMPGRSIPKTVSLPEKILGLGLQRADEVRQGNFSGFLSDLIEAEPTSVRLPEESFKRVTERASLFKMPVAQYLAILIDQDYRSGDDTKTLLSEEPGDYGLKPQRPRLPRRREER